MIATIIFKIISIVAVAIIIVVVSITLLVFFSLYFESNSSGCLN